jgi:hypothetical protein
MVSRGNQHMALEDGPRIQERHHEIVSQDYLGWHQAGDDVAEDAAADGTTPLILEIDAGRPSV